jgi:hypothetical protein
MGAWFGLYPGSVAAVIVVWLVFKVAIIIKAKQFVRHKISLGLAKGVL